MHQFLSNTLSKLSRSQKFGLVLGNEAADLDSVVSSIACAYLFSKIKKFTFLPMINLPKLEELSLRGEVVHWLKENQLCSNVEDVDPNAPTSLPPIPCIPDVLQSIEKATDREHYSYHVTLVDHQGGDYPDELSVLYSHVTDVIDHHEPFHSALDDEIIDHGVELNGKKYFVKAVGSCSTLIAEMYCKHWSTLQSLCADEMVEGPLTALKLLYGAILLDTDVCAPDNGRTTHRDVSMMLWIEETLNAASLPLQRDVVHQQLSSVMLDTTDFSLWDLLRKDLKYIRQEHVPVIAVPSIKSYDFSDFLSNDTWRSSVNALCTATKPPTPLAVVDLLGFRGEEKKETRRCLLLYSLKEDMEEVKKLKDHLITDADVVSKLQLSVVEDISCETAVILKINNPKVTRKAILPALESYLKKIVVSGEELPLIETSTVNTSTEQSSGCVDIVNGPVVLNLPLLAVANGCNKRESSPSCNSPQMPHTPVNSYSASPTAWDAGFNEADIASGDVQQIKCGNQSYLLPTMNNRRMVEMVALKRRSLEHLDDIEGTSTALDEINSRITPDVTNSPSTALFTPDNSEAEESTSVSSMVSALPSATEDRPSPLNKGGPHLPSFNNKAMVQQVARKRRGLRSQQRENGETSPSHEDVYDSHNFTPDNSLSEDSDGCVEQGCSAMEHRSQENLLFSSDIISSPQLHALVKQKRRNQKSFLSEQTEEEDLECKSLNHSDELVTENDCTIRPEETLECREAQCSAQTLSDFTSVTPNGKCSPPADNDTRKSPDIGSPLSNEDASRIFDPSESEVDTVPGTSTALAASAITEQTSMEFSAFTTPSSHQTSATRMLKLSRSINLEIQELPPPTSPDMNAIMDLECMDLDDYEMFSNPQSIPPSLLNAITEMDAFIAAAEAQTASSIESFYETASVEPVEGVASQSGLVSNVNFSAPQSRRLEFRAEPPGPEENFLCLSKAGSVAVDISHSGSSSSMRTCSSSGLPQMSSLMSAEVKEKGEEEPQSSQGSPSSRKRYVVLTVKGVVSEVDMDLIEKHMGVLTHGGYFYNVELSKPRPVAILVLNACRLPCRDVAQYEVVIDSLFRFIVHYMEAQIKRDYVLVYFHGGAKPEQIPRFRLLKQFYQLIDHNLKKQLKRIYIVHPTIWIKAILTCCRPFLNQKFYSKVRYINTLKDLAANLPTEFIQVPEPVICYDQRILKKH